MRGSGEEIRPVTAIVGAIEHQLPVRVQPGGCIDSVATQRESATYSVRVELLRKDVKSQSDNDLSIPCRIMKLPNLCLIGRNSTSQ